MKLGEGQTIVQKLVEMTDGGLDHTLCASRCKFGALLVPDMPTATVLVMSTSCDRLSRRVTRVRPSPRPDQF